MSKDIIIEEGGVGRQFTGVTKLQTKQIEGGVCYWVPEDETELTNKTITENGTYRAADDGVYGWDTINVNVPGGAGGDPGGIGSSIVGIDPTDGEEYAVEINEDGEIEKTKLPVRIEVITPPTKTEYEDGETINPTGIVVRAYYADGTEYGSVLPSELGYEPERAEYSGSGDQTAESTLDTSPIIQPIPFGQNLEYKSHGGGGSSAYTYTNTYTFNNSGACVAIPKPNGAGFIWVFATASPGAIITEHIVGINDATGNVFEDRTTAYTVDQSYTADGKTVYYSSNGISGGRSYELVTPPPAYEYAEPWPSREVAWTVIYGTLSGGGTQTITVKWPRIIDRKVLTATFDITVTGGSDDTHESGNF